MSVNQQSSVMFFGFAFKETDILPMIRVIGWERKEAHDRYEWDCRKYKGKYRLPCLFQYTVSGEGEIDLDGRKERLKAGQAFLVEKPGPFRYYLPADSSHWEFKFVVLAASFPYWQKLVSMAGRVLDIGSDSPIIALWDNMYRLAQDRAFQDNYHNSSVTYEFLMEMNRWVAQKPQSRDDAKPLEHCLKWIDSNFHKPIALDDLVRTTRFSRPYFTRLFMTNMGETPIEYLTKIRIKHAAELLVQTSLPIEEVAKHSGFTNGNYFTKVFRRMVGITPRDFRNHTELPLQSSVHFLP